jgi:hypothetical protein
LVRAFKGKELALEQAGAGLRVMTGTAAEKKADKMQLDEAA